MKTEKPTTLTRVLVFSPVGGVGFYMMYLCMFSDFLDENQQESVFARLMIAAVAIYFLWNYLGACFFANLSWNHQSISFRKGSPRYVYVPQTGYSGSYKSASTDYVFATFLAVFLRGEGGGMVIPLPVGWKRMGEWFPPLVEACLSNGGQMNYNVAKELESGKRFTAMPELAQRVRDYLDAAGPFDDRVLKN